MCFLTAFVFLFVYVGTSAFAFSPDSEQRKILDRKVLRNDLEACSPSDGSEVEVGEGAPEGTLFPNLDPAAMADAINKYIEKENPDSKMKNLGETIVAGAENSNINPFLIVSIAYKESQLADPSDYNIRHGNNAFGRTATDSQPNFQGARLWYKWSSVKASFDHTAEENKGAEGGGDIAAYLRVQYGGDLDEGDLESFMNKYAPPFENDTAAYISNIRDWMKEMIKLAGTGDAPAEAGESTGDIRNVFVVGDSITYTAEKSPHDMKKEFGKKGITAVISGSAGSTVEDAGTKGDPYSGLQAVSHYSDAVKGSDAVVVALGTNHYPSGFGNSIEKMIDKIKSVNGSAAIFWVNTYTKSSGGQTQNGEKAWTASSSQKKNETIKSQASNLGYTLIDITPEGNDPGAPDIKLNVDKIHPEFDESGMGVWIDTIVKKVAEGAAAQDAPSVSGNCTCSATGSTIPGATNEIKVWNYFVGEKNLPAKSVAGILGNMSQESGFDPQNIQDPAGRTKDPSDISAGWGLIQWTEGSKILGIAEEAKIRGPIYLLRTQLDIVWWHMTTPGETPTGDTFSVNSFKNMEIEEATDYFEEKIEGAGDPQMAKRYEFANQAFEKYNGRGEAPTPSGGDGCSGGTGVGTGDFIWPIEDKTYGSQGGPGMCWKGPRDGGRLHGGLDIGALGRTDLPALAVDGGKVEFTGEATGFGNTVVINHGNNLWSLYAHLASINVEKGSNVSQGEKIGIVGNTGGNYPVHLHLQIEAKGGVVSSEAEQTLNPINYLPDDGHPTGNCVKGDAGYR
jgi:murein DD-endopeptidase MepM/ murein hydrolase activator NlpD